MTKKRQTSGIIDSSVGARFQWTTSKPAAGGRGSDGFYTEEHSIFDGQGRIVRTKNSGDVWQLVCRISEEKKTYRRSLKTKDIATAKALAQDRILELRHKARIGERIFGEKFDDVFSKFIEFKMAEANAAILTAGRVATLRSILSAASKFIGGGRPIGGISGAEWASYAVWRRGQHPGIKDVTLTNEKAAISSLYKFAERNGFIGIMNKPQFARSNKLSAEAIDRRSALTIEEYRAVYQYLKTYKGLAKNEIDGINRELVRYFIIILANTGLRFGELRLLRWSDVSTFDFPRANGELERLCEITVRSETTKTRRSRTVQGRRGDVFDTIKSRSKYSDSSSFVFSDPETGGQFSKKILYKMWSEIVTSTGLSGRSDITFYSLRHTYATLRLLADVDVYTLAMNMGCSVQYIEKHYGHVKTSQKRAMLVQRG